MTVLLFLYGEVLGGSFDGAGGTFTFVTDKLSEYLLRILGGVINMLEYLAKKCGCDILSDLPHYGEWRTVLKHIRTDQFPLKDWNDAVEYLTKKKFIFESAEKAKEYLLNGK